jgi:hypothetical protein
MNFLTSHIPKEIVRREKFLTFSHVRIIEKTMRMTGETACSFTSRLIALLAAFSHFSRSYKGMGNEKRERPPTPPSGTGTPGTGARGVPFAFWPGVAHATEARLSYER